MTNALNSYLLRTFSFILRLCYVLQVAAYPAISLSHDAVHLAAREDARHVFLHVEEKLLKRIMSTWYNFFYAL